MRDYHITFPDNKKVSSSFIQFYHENQYKTTHLNGSNVFILNCSTFLKFLFVLISSWNCFRNDSKNIVDNNGYLNSCLTDTG